jgi:hypothetical protein
MELRILKGLWELLLHFGAIGDEIRQAQQRKSGRRQAAAGRLSQ